MAREKYQTLTEQMFYILLCLTREQCGVDIMERVREMTEGRVVIGPGTLYSLLESFQQEGFIRETKVEGRRRSYRITPGAGSGWTRSGSGWSGSWRITGGTERRREP